MSFNLSLTEDQIKTIMEGDPNVGLSFFRDSNGSDVLSEGDNFHTRLKFYLSKTGSTRSEMLAYFRNAYPTLLSSESGLNHIINGIRTPKLSVVMGMAEFLEIAPAALLPGVPGSFIVKENDHVELLDNPVLLSDEDNIEEVTEDVLNQTLEEIKGKEEILLEDFEAKEIMPEIESMTEVETEIVSLMIIDQPNGVKDTLQEEIISDTEPEAEVETEPEAEPEVEDEDEPDLEEIDDLLNSIF